MMYVNLVVMFQNITYNRRFELIIFEMFISPLLQMKEYIQNKK